MIVSPYLCPCKGCNKRDAECHGSCQAYLEWVEKTREYKEAYSKSKEASGYVTTVAHEKFYKRVELNKMRDRRRRRR